MVALNDLPTRAQIRALTSVPVLERLRDDVLAEILQIEAQLENPTRGDDWKERAVNALAAFRFTRRLADQRLDSIRFDRKSTTAVRPEADIAPLTRAALDAWPQVDASRLETHQAVDEVLSQVVATLEAVRRDREDEIAQVPIERDEAFLAATGPLVRHLAGLRQTLQNRRGQITKAIRLAEHEARQSRREQLFIQAAKTRLPEDTYRDLWLEVDLLERTETREPAHG